MNAEELKVGTKAFALRIMKLVDAMPRKLASQVIAGQILRSATSVGANYRAACRPQSRAEFSSKVSFILEETDETLYWLELPEESGLISPERLKGLIKEANELLAIFIASRKTSKHIQ
jgi:four helix bundle protein